MIKDLDSVMMMMRKNGVLNQLFSSSSSFFFKKKERISRLMLEFLKLKDLLYLNLLGSFHSPGLPT